MTVSFNNKIMRVGVFVQCYNEAAMLPWFIRYYQTMLPGCTICVMDNESTDDTARIAQRMGCMVHSFSTNNTLDDIGRLELKEKARVYMPGMDWILNVDTDEYLVVNMEDLEMEKAAGTSVFRTCAYDLRGDSMYADLRDLNVFAISRGSVPPAHDDNKPMCYAPSLVTRMNYEPGCHRARPAGTVRLSRKKYMFYHFHGMGVAFQLARYVQNDSRNNSAGKQLGIHYTAREHEIRSQYGAHDFIMPVSELLARYAFRQHGAVHDGSALVTIDNASLWKHVETHTGVEHFAAARLKCNTPSGTLNTVYEQLAADLKLTFENAERLKDAEKELCAQHISVIGDLRRIRENDTVVLHTLLPHDVVHSALVAAGAIHAFRCVTGMHFSFSDFQNAIARLEMYGNEPRGPLSVTPTTPNAAHKHPIVTSPRRRVRTLRSATTRTIGIRRVARVERKQQVSTKRRTRVIRQSKLTVRRVR